MEAHKLKAYASAYSAYLIDKLASHLDKIKSIILFGSVAHETPKEDSDVDIFIDVKSESKKIDALVNRFTEDFYKTNQALVFATHKIDNKINPIVGSLKEWKSLHRSIMSSGIVLWGPFVAAEKPTATKHMVVFYWSGIAKNRGAFLNKIYGFTTGKKKYEGLLSKLGGQRLGKSCILVPISERETFIKLLRKYEVSFRSVEVFVG